MRVLGGVAHVVVVAGQVERDEDCPADRPARVLAILARLHFDRERGRAEERAPGGKASRGILAIEPFVVTGDQHELVLQARELLLARREPRIAAAEPAAAD